MPIVRPKKRLGQHFLADEQIAERIARTAEPFLNHPILEIGPGMGMLTKYLLELGADLEVVELDGDSVKYLNENFPQIRDKIHYQDFLKMDLTQLFGGEPFSVIGNYPYNISSQIFFKILEYRDQIICCSGMLQKEVAERLVSGPGKKSFGILSVLLQLWYDTEYLFSVPPGVFIPPPKVNSGVIRLTRNERKEANFDENLLKTIVKMGFNQRRKTLKNSLKSLIQDCEELKKDPIMDKRPEQLGVEELIALTNKIGNLDKI